MTIGQRIKAARKKANMTQAELAQKLDIPFQSVSQWERDVRNPKFETLRKIASFLDIDPYVLMTGDMAEAHSIGFEEGLEFARNTEDEIYRRQSSLRNALLERAGYSFSETEHRLIYTLSLLNDEGQQKAIERIEELAEIPKYKKTPQE